MSLSWVRRILSQWLLAPPFGDHGFPTTRTQETRAIDEEKLAVGYEAAVEMINHQAADNWSRFNALLISNSVLLAAVGFVLTEKLRIAVPVLPLAGIGCGFGLLLCIFWSLLIWRGDQYVKYWNAVARELENRLGGFNLFRRGRRFGAGEAVEVDGERLRKQCLVSVRSVTWMYLIIGLFAAVYVAILATAAATSGEAPKHEVDARQGLAWLANLTQSSLWREGIGFVAGFAASILSVVLIDWIRRPRVSFIGFERVPVNFGVLHKIQFRLRGRASPGLCRFDIHWDGRQVPAKWDEAPNPLEADDLNQFRPELVPATFYQPLFQRRDYAVPILIERNGQLEVFSGWWFGRGRGYGPNPDLGGVEEIRLALNGAGLHWSRQCRVAEILGG